VNIGVTAAWKMHKSDIVERKNNNGAWQIKYQHRRDAARG